MSFFNDKLSDDIFQKGPAPRVTTFHLMRLVHETADPVTKQISEYVSKREWKTGPPPSDLGGHPNATPGSLFFMNFWNMKQRGELHVSEIPAVYAVMMRAVPAAFVVRVLLEHGFTHYGHMQHRAQKHMPERALLNYLTEVTPHSHNPKPKFVSKLRGNLVARIRAVQARRGGSVDMTMLDADDTDLLLRACQTAMELKQEDDKRWRVLQASR